MRKLMARRRVVRLAGLATAFFIVAGGVAYATIPDAGKVYTACMLKNVGTVRLIDPSLPSSNVMSHCTSLETQITWNEVGQQGAAGPVGPAGALGLAGKDGTNGTDGAPGETGAAGPAGPKGDTGATGDAGAAGPAGPAGPKGDTGDTGPAGPAGPAGATGATGPQGPAGADGSGGASTVSITTRRGVTSLPTGNLAFLSATVPVTITAGQSIEVSSSVMLGTTDAASAANLHLWICYQTASQFTIAHGNDDIDPLAAADSRNEYSLTDTLTFLQAGSYTVGMCGYVGVTNNLWNTSDWSYTTAQVFSASTQASS